jgi:hypothetical protein
MSDSFIKAPAELLDYGWDWAPWLAEVNDTISAATVSVPEGLTAVGSPVVDDAVVTQRVTGGAEGATCKMVFQITTAGGLIGQRSIYLTILER